MEIEWESINKSNRGYTERMKVFNGWLVRTFDAEYGSFAITFVKDKKHLWREDVNNYIEAVLLGEV